MHDSYTNITANMCASQIHENNNLSDFQSLVPSIISYIVRLTKFGSKFLLTFLLIFFSFLLSSILGNGVRAWHHYYTVTSHMTQSQ